MKHLKKVSKATPASAWWFGWFTTAGELQKNGAKSAYVNLLFDPTQNNGGGTLDPRDEGILSALLELFPNS